MEVKYKDKTNKNQENESYESFTHSPSVVPTIQYPHNCHHCWSGSNATQSYRRASAPHEVGSREIMVSSHFQKYSESVRTPMYTPVQNPQISEMNER